MSGGPGQIGKKCIRSLRCKHGAQHWEQGSTPRFLYRNTGSYGGSFENQWEVQMALKLFRMSVLPFLMSFNFVPHVKARLTHCSNNLSRWTCLFIFVNVYLVQFWALLSIFNLCASLTVVTSFLNVLERDKMLCFSYSPEIFLRALLHWFLKLIQLSSETGICLLPFQIFTWTALNTRFCCTSYRNVTSSSINTLDIWGRDHHIKWYRLYA